MNNNKEVAEVELFCFRFGKFLVSGNNCLTLRTAEKLYEESEKKMRLERMDVCICVFCDNSGDESTQKQQQDETKRLCC